MEKTSGNGAGRKYNLLQLYVVLVLTIMFFMLELVMSHISHALTLLMDAYFTLCNILALFGCIVAVKYDTNTEKATKRHTTLKPTVTVISMAVEDKQEISPCSRGENRLKNTFGWARIDVISMLVCCIFMGSLSFSVVVEALQTLVHINHWDEMHYPIACIVVALIGLFLNLICYLLIGGYTYHQGTFLTITEDGGVYLRKIVILTDADSNSKEAKERRLTRTKPIMANNNSHQQIPDASHKHAKKFVHTLRDISGLLLVAFCAVLVYFSDRQTAKYIDPLLSLISATLLMALSYPYIKESCLILMETIPASINIDMLKKDLMNHFPDIVNVHDFHVWQLTASKVISTVHIIFRSELGYEKILTELKDYFLLNGITHVTIQPEFQSEDQILQKSEPHNECLMRCNTDECKRNHCCAIYSMLA